jgi:hypothetical protein
MGYLAHRRVMFLLKVTEELEIQISQRMPGQIEKGFRMSVRELDEDIW